MALRRIQLSSYPSYLKLRSVSSRAFREPKKKLMLNATLRSQFGGVLCVSVTYTELLLNFR